MNSGSPAVSYRECESSGSLKRLVKRELKKARLRRGKTISNNLQRIMNNLTAGEWPTLLEHLNTLRRYTTKYKELQVVKYLQQSAGVDSKKTYPGLGPKQARNLIQSMGLSRYVIPLDSRVMRTLSDLGCMFVPGSTGLADEAVYQFVEEGLQEAAKRLGIYPCELDAYAFSGPDTDQERDV
jgi:hypothetical protein